MPDTKQFAKIAENAKYASTESNCYLPICFIAKYVQHQLAECKFKLIFFMLNAKPKFCVQKEMIDKNKQWKDKLKKKRI